MSSSIRNGNLNAESVELNSIALNLYNRIQLDSSLITRKDLYMWLQLVVLLLEVHTSLHYPKILPSIELGIYLDSLRSSTK